MSFSSLGLHPGLLRSLDARGFRSPTDIQTGVIAPALQGRDVLGCAATGSGKTAAFLLPILHHLLEHPRRGTRALVLAPTRELALQIVDEARLFAKGTPLRAAAVVGGVGMGPQLEAMRSGVDLLVATPGRLLDLLNTSPVRLDSVEFLVLDEADRMLDMGFLPDVRRILSRVPRGRQTFLLSATMPPPIATLAGELMKEPVRVGSERKAAPAASVTQHAWPVAATRKADLLVELLRRGEVAEVLAFTRTKHRADRLARVLSRSGIPADRIHGDRSQGQRVAALAAFKSGKIRVLVATDIAARGIDIEELGHVVNFDVPKCPEDYIHRVGRTGRASATGDAFTFVSPEEEGDLRQIEKVLGGTRIARRALDGFDASAPAGEQANAPRPQGSQARSRTQPQGQRSRGGQGAPGGGRGTAPGSASTQGAARSPHGHHAHGAGHEAAGGPRRGAGHATVPPGRHGRGGRGNRTGSSQARS